MSMLTNVGAYMWGVGATFPFIGFAVVYFAVFRWKKDKRYAVRWAVNITNLLLIHAVVTAYSLLWPDAWSAWWWIALLFLGLFLLIAWLQIRFRGRISLRKISFSIWRISFFLFCLAYLFLFTTGVWKTIQLG
ncbi:DUF3397 domain-containing protein [Brevibacillus sp. SYP-B805]|uniref:DUF3397 family protein n=1 Tax=Brevibacillus sp. SYP-B805 TaxID=1578199 RepID=UPI0013EAFA6F|nr:DUF3397 family protein [Brevibacillus sp. SYP-B805]NGQ93702.1 DUF3397 domain-containing protein [Brevibacillus sp. SYP-B805]